MSSETLVEFSSEGINFGNADIQGKQLSFTSSINNKMIFNLPLENISTCVVPSTNKDDVEIQFQENQDNNKDDDTLIQITFHFPQKKAIEEDVDAEDENAQDFESKADSFYRLVNEIGGTQSVTGHVIIEFSREQGNFVTPRGKYALQMTSTYMYMQGAQYFYKIPYTDITALFLLPKLDGGRMAFVIALDKPIRQGNQKYQYLVIETHKVPQSITVNLTPEEIEKDYEGLEPEMNMPLCNLIAKVFKILSQKSVFIPKSFVTTRGGHAVRCALKANDGLLYPLAKSFIFINKPTVYISFDDIEMIDFRRYDTNAATRNFDLVISLKASAVSSNEPKEYVFASIDRGDFPALIEYFQAKALPVNKPEEAEKRRIYDEDDEDDNADKGSVDSEEEDDDYVGGDNDDDDDDDASDDASDDDASDDDSKPKSKKRKN